MTKILELSPVNYVCACGHLNPITKLFFCRHCLKQRCGFCVCHEVSLWTKLGTIRWLTIVYLLPFFCQVDSHFCYNCLENIPSGEAKLKKYRCNKCFECPSCQHTLSSRATTVQVPRTEGDAKDAKDVKVDTSSPASTNQPAEAEKAPKPLTRKMYYLSCLACRWTSRDAGLPDQTNGK